MSRRRPNIVFFLLDNVGFGDPGCYGGRITRRAQTPRIDRLAAQGPDGLDTRPMIDSWITDDTIVVWASDNGPLLIPPLGPQADSGPFRGYLGSAYEGQLRVPCIVRWPGHVEPGRVSDDIVSILDFYATFAAVAGAADRVPTDRAIDSLDQTAHWLGKAPSPRDHVIAFVGDTLAAVKWRQFKLHFVEFGNEPGHRYRVDLATPQLFNVASDPKELWDIMEPNTWIVQATSPILKAYTDSVRRFPHVPTGGNGPAASTDKRPLTPRG